ncbi:MAG: MFS transporter [Akkermansiaceae bacterium]|nr:MFS transporter [Akkermansiaceae bacterium]MCF7734294.1 MFS transporter [Akkermansiaceae bacterium]
MTKPHQSNTAVRLSVMMFLQFFLWGSWFVTLYLVLGGNKLAGIIGDSYSSAPIAAMIAPLFLGLVADRFFSSERVMGVLLLIGGGLMLLVPGAVAAGDGKLVVWLFMGHMLCYMPTLGLGNTIAFSHLPREVFPRVRVWGTIGWIAAGLVAGFLGWSASPNLFWMAGTCSVLLGVYSFSLPHTPPPSAGQPVNLRAMLMLDAFRLLSRPAFLVFMICSMLICIPLAYYFANTSGYLGNMGFEQPVSAMTVGQMSEIFFMLLVPFFFRRLGVKWMILVGMLAWVLRYMLFAFGAPEQVVWMLFFGIALHGICYDFFFVTGFMYTDRTAPKEVRGQAQSMVVFFTQGVGMFLGFKFADLRLGPVRESSAALGEMIAAGRGGQELSFLDQLVRMFSVKMPAGVDPGLLQQTAGLWKTYWMLPAGMAAVIAVIFFLLFRDQPTDES